MITWTTVGRYRPDSRDRSPLESPAGGRAIDVRLLLPDAARYLRVKLCAALLSVMVSCVGVIGMILVLFGQGWLFIPTMIGAFVVGLFWMVVGLMKPLARPLSRDIQRW